MKRLLLFLISVAVSTAVLAQQSYQLTKAQKEKEVKLTYVAPVKEPVSINKDYNPTVRSAAADPMETTVGMSRYDLWTNSMVTGRIYQHPDGTIGAVWMWGFQETSFPDRGTGYNYYDGSSWGPQPTDRIESLKTGWPNYCPWGPNGEIIVAHNGVTGLEIETRENKGTGDWTSTLYQGPAGIENDPTWPRLATGGVDHETIHMIYNSYTEYNGQTTALLYSRSTDGGATWDPRDMTFDELGPDYYSEVPADGYAIIADGDNVAILVCDTWSSDMVLMKSTDAGTTWNETIIWEHPYPFYDWDVTITDTFFAPDGAASLAFGPDGKVHVAFSLCRVLHEAVGTQYTLWPYADGIVYWNEDMPVFTPGLNTLATPVFEYNYPFSELVEDYNYIGYMPDVDGNGSLDILGEFLYYRTIGSSTWPAITVDNSGQVFVVYSTLTEGYDNFTYNFHHIWGRAYANGEWGPLVDQTSNIIHIFDECIYPVISPTSNDQVHFIYMADQIPGLALDDDQEYVDNNFIVSSVPKTDLLTGIDDKNDLVNESNVSQNYPNPFSGQSTIMVNLTSGANLSLEVTNLVGQRVIQVERGEVPAGVYQFQVDGTNLKDGIYFYTVRASNSSVTKKMIIK